MSGSRLEYSSNHRAPHPTVDFPSVLPPNEASMAPKGRHAL